MRYYWSLFFAAIVVCLTLQPAYAVPPPDFLFTLGVQAVQVFTVAFIFLGAVFGTIGHYLRALWGKIKHPQALSAGMLAGVLVFSGLGAFAYLKLTEYQAYQTWIQDSAKINQATYSNDPLSASGTHVTEKEPTSSEQTEFIRSYYNNIAMGNLQAAYNVSKKSVSYDTFASWYKNTQGVEIHNIQNINDTSYSIRLTLQEKSGNSELGVLMGLEKTGTGWKIASSEVRELAPGTTNSKPAEATGASLGFYEANRHLTLQVRNDEFKKIVSSGAPFVLDAREDEEYAIGRFPGSTHIRFADLQAGRWLEIPTDKVVYVFCWSGMRGKEVAEFLRSKNIVARFVERGADSWVAEGGMWEGSSKFSSVYKDNRYQRVISADEIGRAVSLNNAFVVDSRVPDKFREWHIPGSINIPTIHTPSSELDGLLKQVPAGWDVITVCDDFVSCFDAKVTGIKLENLGHTFRGRFNKPWEYKTLNIST